MGQPVALVGVDRAGDLIGAAGPHPLTVNRIAVALVGDPVADHDSSPPHTGVTMVAASAVLTVNGRPVCRLGDAASCGHTATGSGTVLTAA